MPVRRRAVEAPNHPDELVNVLGQKSIVATTATGNIYLRRARVRWGAPSESYLRLQQLHHRAIGRRGPYSLQLPSTLSRSEAFTTYSNGLMVALAQLAVSPPKARRALLADLSDFVVVHGALDGLEALLLSGIRAAQAVDDLLSAAAGADALSRVGLPDALGGGALTSPILDVATGELTLATLSDLAAMARGGGQDVGGASSGFHGMSPSEVLSALGNRGGLDSLFAGAIPALGGPGGNDSPIPADGGHGGSGDDADTVDDGLKWAQVGAIIGGTIALIACAMVCPPAAGVTVGALADFGGVGAVLGGAAGFGAGVALPLPDAPFPRPEKDTDGPSGGTPSPEPSTPEAPEPSTGDGSDEFTNLDDPAGNDTGTTTMGYTGQGPGLDALTVNKGVRRFALVGLPSCNEDGSMQSTGFLPPLVRGIAPIDFVPAGAISLRDGRRIGRPSTILTDPDQASSNLLTSAVNLLTKGPPGDPVPPNIALAAATLISQAQSTRGGGSAPLAGDGGGRPS